MPKSRRHILLLEDHRDVRAAFVALFEAIYGFSIHVAAGTREAVGLLDRQNVDVAVVDLASGAELSDRLEMIRSWRSDGLDFPVIATTTVNDAHIAEISLNAGVDDVVRKPYPFAELHARIQRQLARRLGSMPRRRRVDGVAVPDRPFEFAGATITPEMKISFPGGKSVRIGAKHLGMLREFARHGGSLLLKDELIYAVWGADANTNSASVHQYLHTLRQLYRIGGINLSAYVVPESKVGWRVVSRRQAAAENSR